MTYLGAHLSSSRGFYKMGLEALAMDANTFQCFVRNPRGARAKAADPADLAKLRELMTEHGFGPIVAHAPYIMNPCSKDEGIRELAARMMAEDLMLMERLTPGYYVFHPGSHVGQGIEEGCRQIAAMLNAVLKEERDKGNYVIAGGDFNHCLIADKFETDELALQAFASRQRTPDWVKNSVLHASELTDGFSIAADESAATCRGADIPYTRGVNYTTVVDGFLVSDNVCIEEEKTVDTAFAYSDHNPVLLRFRLIA